MKRLWPWIWVALAIVLVVRTGVRERGVITDHVEFGRRLVQGEPLYAPYPEPGADPAAAKPLHPVYPPSFGLLTAPFSLLPERGARFAWALLQVGSLLAICRVLVRALGDVAPALRTRTHTNVLLALTLALGSRYVLRDTHGGGGNLVNLALALLAFACARAGRGVAAALLLGFSLATKPVLVLLVPLLWIFGRGRAALGALLSAGTFLALALLVHGRGLEPLARWMEGSFAYATRADPFAVPDLGFPPFTWMNQSLRPAVGRWLGDVPDAYRSEVPGFVPGLGLDNALAGGIATLLNVVLVAITFTLVVRWRRSVAAQHHLLAAVLALSLLLSPISWKAHHVALLPAFFWLWVAAAERRAWVVLAAVYALLCLAGEELTGKALKNLQQSLYLVTLGTVAMWAFSLLRAGRVAAWDPLPGAAAGPGRRDGDGAVPGPAGAAGALAERPTAR